MNTLRFTKQQWISLNWQRRHPTLSSQSVTVNHWLDGFLHAVQELAVCRERLRKGSSCCGQSPLTWHRSDLLQCGAEKHFSSPAVCTQRKPLCPSERTLIISTLQWRSFVWRSSSSVSTWEADEVTWTFPQRCELNSDEFYVWIRKAGKTRRPAT